jgi:RNA polymerase sigma-70 factor (ECF subfamily)
VDTAPAQPADESERLPRTEEEVRASGPIDPALLHELWQAAGAVQVELSEVEFGHSLLAIGARHNFGLAPGAEATAAQRAEFWRALHLADLALAQGCALGREAAWQQFVARYRGPLLQAAIGITRSSGLGEELADALYSELYGLTMREGVRWSPLSTYSGRGSLMGWLRAMLVQRHVNHYRKTHRETPLEDLDVASAPEVPPQNRRALRGLEAALQSALMRLSAEDRVLLAAYYLDRHTLMEIGNVLRVHEATVSRKLKRVMEHVRKDLLRALQAHGLSRRAAEEALGTDPRQVDINLRKLLQTPATDAFSNTKGQS